MDSICIPTHEHGNEEKNNSLQPPFDKGGGLHAAQGYWAVTNDDLNHPCHETHPLSIYYLQRDIFTVRLRHCTDTEA